MAQGIFLHNYDTKGTLYDTETTGNFQDQYKIVNRKYVTDNALLKANNLNDVADLAETQQNLELEPGVDIQAYSAKLASLSDLAFTDGGFVVGNGSAFVLETAGTARTSLGLGSIATQAANNVTITGGSISGITDLAVTDGGTGSSTAAGARSNLGLGTISTQAANNVTITGGSISGITDLAIADGGTGASNASGARTNLGLGTSATQDTGISSGNVFAAAANIVDNDFLRVDGSAVEGLSAAEVLGQLSGAAGAAFSMNSQKITNVATPTADNDAANKAYVDSSQAGLDVKESVRAASTANFAGSFSSGVLTLTAEAAVTSDGVSLAVSDRVLLKDQTDPAENGIYTLTTQGAAGSGGGNLAISDFDFYEDSGFSDLAEPAIAAVGGGTTKYTNSGFSSQVSNSATTTATPMSITYYTDSIGGTTTTTGGTKVRFARLTFNAPDYDSSWTSSDFNCVQQQNGNKTITNFSLSFNDAGSYVDVTVDAGIDDDFLINVPNFSSAFNNPKLVFEPTFQYIQATFNPAYSITQSELEAASWSGSNSANVPSEQKVGIASATNTSGNTWRLTLDSAIPNFYSNSYIHWGASTSQYVQIQFDSSVSISDLPSASDAAAGRFTIDSTDHEIASAVRVSTTVGSPDIRKYKFTLDSATAVILYDSSVTNEWYDPAAGGTQGVLTRASDFDASSEVTAGAFCFVEEGTAHADSGFVVTSNDDITIDSSDIVFTQFSGAGQITAGAGLTKTGNQIDVVGGDGIVANANDIAIDLATASGLEISSGKLQMDLKANSGLEFDSNELSFNLSASSISGTLGISDGGTGSTTASGARTALGLGSISTQNSNNVTITGGSISGITDLAVTDGGTGSSTASGARTNLGLVIGTHVQAYDAQLDTLAGYTAAQVTRGIADDNLLTVDDSDAADNDYAKFTANGIEGRSFSEVKSDLGLVIGTDVQAYDAQLDTLSGFTAAQVTRGIADDNLITADCASHAIASGDFAKFTADGVEGREASQVRSDLSLVPGTDIQAYDAGLQSISGLATSADKMIYTTGSDTYAVTSLSSFARTLLDDADAATMRATLGAAGTDSTELSVDVSEPSSIAIGDVDGMYVYDISSNSTALTVDLPSTATAGCLGKSVIFKIKSTVGSSSSLTISGQTNQSIDGEASIVLNQERQSIKLVISEEHSSGATQCWVVV
jgi:hypothetical protein